MIYSQFVRPVLRHKKKAAVLLLSTIMAAVGVSMLTRPKFRSESQLFFRLGRENVAIDPTATLSDDNRIVSTPQVRENEINSAVAILTSRALAEEVVDSLGPETILGLSSSGAGGEAQGVKSVVQTAKATVRAAVLRPLGAPDLPVRDQAIERVLKGATVVAVAESRVIRITFESHKPEVAQQVVQTLVQQFLDKHMRLNRTPRSESFLHEQAERLRGELASAEDAVRALKNRTGLSAAKYQVEILADQIAAAETTRAETLREVVAARQEVATLREALGSVPEQRIVTQIDGKPNVGADGMREQLYTLERLEQELLAKYTPDYIEVRQVQGQMAKARDILAAEASRGEVTRGVNPAYTAVETELHRRDAALQGLEAKQGTIDAEIARLERRRVEVTDAEVQLAQLERESKLKEARYQTFAGKLDEAQIDRALEEQRISNIGILQEATLEAAPQNLNPLRNLILGVLAGCAGAAGVVYLCESTATAVRLPADVEQRTGIPLLLVIPELRRAQIRSTVQPA